MLCPKCGENCEEIGTAILDYINAGGGESEKTLYQCFGCDAYIVDMGSNQ